MKHKIWIGLGIFLVVLLAGSAALFGYRSMQLQTQLSEANARLTESRQANSDLLDASTQTRNAAQTTQSQQPTDQSAALDENVTFAWDGLTTSTQDTLADLLPFSSDQYLDIKSLGSNFVVLVQSKNDQVMGNDLRAFLVNPANESMRLLEHSSDFCAGLRLEDWIGGVVVSGWTSPCEAVGEGHSMYLDKDAIAVAKVQEGDFGRDGTTVDGKIGDVTLHAQLIQGSACNQTGPEQEKPWPPTTTIMAVKVNGKSFALSNPIGVECQLGYGDSVGNVGFPGVSFDGQRFTFRLPGYDAAISQNGNVSFTLRPAYVIQYRGRLVYEDKAGLHSLRSSIADEPILKDVLPISETSAAYSFEIATIDGHVIKIKIIRFNHATQKNEDTGMTLEYDTTTDTFQNLIKP